MHHQGAALDENLSKRYFLMLDTIVKPKAREGNRKDGPPHVMFLRNVLSSLPSESRSFIAEQVRRPSAATRVIAACEVTLKPFGAEYRHSMSR